MKYVDEFRDRDKAVAVVREIEALARAIGSGRQRPIQIMEVCGAKPPSVRRLAEVPSFFRCNSPKPNAPRPWLDCIVPAPLHSGPSTPDSKLLEYTMAACALPKPNSSDKAKAAAAAAA